jgi:hypothetical protein
MPASDTEDTNESGEATRPFGAKGFEFPACDSSAQRRGTSKVKALVDVVGRTFRRVDNSS